MHRLQRIWVLFLGILWLVGRAGAHETDQFTIPADREFADLGGCLNEWIYDTMDRGVEKVNGEIRECVEQKRGESALAELQSADHIVRAVNGEFPWAMDVIEGWDERVNSSEMKRRYPGRVIGYKHQIGNILQHTHLPIDPRQFFRLFLASTIKGYGTYFGNDKIGHFTDMGMNYYRAYRGYLRDGKSEEEASREAVRTGTHGLIFSERGMLGYLTAGAYSNGDLAANYLGFLFYRNLTEPTMLKGRMQPPMLVRDGPYWKMAPHVRRDSDFFAVFISDQLDEALNPSLFETGMRSAVRSAVKERAGRVLWRYRDEQGNVRPREYFERKLAEVATYYGQDYGHDGEPDQLVSIANTCFDESGKPIVRVEADPALPRGERFGATPLHAAAARRDAGEVQSLLARGQASTVRDDFGCTPLHDAARAGDEKAVEALLRAGAEVNAADDYGSTPLHLACRHGHILVARMLLEKGAQVNARNLAGCTPLHEAALSGDRGVVALLLIRGADAGARNARGRLAAEIADERKEHRVAELIRAAAKEKRP